MSIIDEGLKALIKKSSSTRLISELKIAQNLLDADTLRELSRTDLVSYVYHLRQLAGKKTPLKDIVPDFKLENVLFSKRQMGMRRRALLPQPPYPHQSYLLTQA